MVVASITNDTDEYAKEVKNELLQIKINCEIDIRNEKIGYKIREHSNSKIPIILAVGKKEAQNKTVSVRRLGQNTTEVLNLEEIKLILKKESLSPID